LDSDAGNIAKKKMNNHIDELQVQGEDNEGNQSHILIVQELEL